jgi:hypothetical protein
VIKSCEITVESLEVTFDGSWFSFVYNVLASLFQQIIKEYVMEVLTQAVMAHMFALMKTLNDHAKDHWPLLLGLTDLELDKLPVITSEELALQEEMARKGEEADVKLDFAGLMGAKSAVASAIKGSKLEAADYEVVFKTMPPMMSLKMNPPPPGNSEAKGGQPVIVGGFEKLKGVQTCGLMQLGDLVVAVGTKPVLWPQLDYATIKMLVESERAKAAAMGKRFRLQLLRSAKLKKAVKADEENPKKDEWTLGSVFGFTGETNAADAAAAASTKAIASERPEGAATQGDGDAEGKEEGVKKEELGEDEGSLYWVDFATDEELSISLEATKNDVTFISEFVGLKGPAELSGKIRLGHLLMKVGDQVVETGHQTGDGEKALKAAQALIAAAKAPCTLTFRNPQKYAELHPVAYTSFGGAEPHSPLPPDIEGAAQ